jgi:membrane protein required for colicin V production
MNWIDLASLVILFTFFVAGLVKGLLRELLLFAGVVASFLVALHLMGLAAIWIEKWVSISGKASLVAGFLLVFLVLLVLSHIVGYVVWRLVRATPLSIADRLAGGVFGLLKAGLIIFFVLLVLSVVPFRGAASTQLEESLAYSMTKRATPLFSKYLRAAAPAFLRALRRARNLPSSLGKPFPDSFALASNPPAAHS